MKKLSILLLLNLLILPAFSQEIQKEINEQVWKPFIKTYNAHDTEGFMALHSKDLIRVPRDGKSIRDYEAYKKGNEEGARRNEGLDNKRTIELRFLERIADEKSAYEVGIFKVTITTPNESPRIFYGKFHVTMRKENGTWKILVDSDSSEGNTIDENAFAKAQAIELP